MDEEVASRRRRRVLRAGASAVALSALGTTASAASVDAAYAPHGQVDIDDAAEAVVGPDGETAFVAVGTGFVTVDVSTPSAPTVVGEARNLQGPEGNSVREVLDVKYDDGRVLVPTAAQGSGPRGFYVFDVSDPANPTQVGDWFPTPNHGNHNASFVDGVAYLTGGLDVDVVDVSGESFERLATWNPGDWNEDWSRLPNTVLHDLYVQGDHAYCAYWDAGVFVLDVSDPAKPTFVSRVGEYSRSEIEELSQQAYLEPPGNAHYACVNEDATLLAEGGESWDLEAGDDSGGPSGITFYDVSEKSNPTKVGHVDPPVSRSNAYRGGTWTTSHNFDLRNGRLYASWYQGGVTVHDVSDPANPERLAWWASPSDRAFWTAQLAKPGEFFVASSHGSSGMTGDVTNGLLTFPDAAGEMAELPSAVAWTDAELEARATTTPTTTASTTMPPTTTTTESTTTTATTEPTTESEASPGLGVLAALGGLGVGAARVVRGTYVDDDA